MAQTVTEVLAAGADSVTLINDINTNGKKSTYVGGTAEEDTTMSQADINEMVQRNVDHLSTILLYDTPNVAGAASNLKTTHVAAVTTGTDYIAAN
jgi:opacity protein-like surface antigen